MSDVWLLVGPSTAQAHLGPLIAAHAERRPVRVFNPDEDWRTSLDMAAGVLIVGDHRCSPRNAVQGLFLIAPGGRRVPVGWLPLASPDLLRRFGDAAASVQRRPPGDIPLALLGQWDDHALRAVARSAKLLSSSETLRSFCWTADRLIRRDLLVAMRLGLGLALYFGHGRPYGWSGYHGLHSRHLRHARGEPTGAIVSLTCNTAARTRGGGYSFSEHLVLEGVAAAAVGSVEPTRTTFNWRWGLGLCRELVRDPGKAIGQVLLASGEAMSAEWLGGQQYRLIGDPLARIAGAVGVGVACAAVQAPDPDTAPSRLLATA